ncbi:hypothetical protein [Streptomyces sp. NBC_00847]|uniref:hypothetical protein n=1 Tax=unclassified Streptomyces TaxID=2593676 RepID=UPI00224CE01C|nr:hypothetical protein [Streptomyces sp. NBC_00847]MCX4881582.1 hypothetical protein [Streptomyces sp. NBC_00847]
MGDGQIRAAVQHAEIPMLLAYRKWFEHTRKCAVGCERAHKAQDGCEAGQELWGEYRLARIGRAT